MFYPMVSVREVVVIIDNVNRIRRQTKVCETDDREKKSNRRVFKAINHQPH